MKRTNDKIATAFSLIGGMALITLGLCIIPPLMDKCSSKIYKASLKKDKMDFDNLGPEIVKTEEKSWQ